MVCKGSIRTSNGWDQDVLGRGRTSGFPGPHTSRLSTRHPRPVRFLPPEISPDSVIIPMVLQCLPYAVLLTSSGTAPVPAQLGSARPTGRNRPRPRTASWQTSQTGRSGTLLQESQWLQRPSRTSKHRIPRSSSSSLRGDPVKHLLHRGFNKPLDFTLASAKHHSGDPLLLGCFARRRTSKSPVRPQARPGHPGAARPGAPNATNRWGRPMLR